VFEEVRQVGTAA
jgi:signal transduction histidine kinase